MRTKPILSSGLVAACLLAASAILSTAATPGVALAQPSPTPPECVCSRGVNLATDGTPVIIRHCQCGILSCAVIVNSGQLQCTK